MSTVAIVGMGLLLVIVVGEIDLSFGFLYGLCANTMAVSWLMWGWPVWLALLAAFGVAVFWGLFNAFFTTVVKIPVVHRDARVRHPDLRIHAAHHQHQDLQLPVSGPGHQGARRVSVDFFRGSPTRPCRRSSRCRSCG